MLQNDSHLNCLCVMAGLIEALAIYYIKPNISCMMCYQKSGVIYSWVVKLVEMLQKTKTLWVWTPPTWVEQK